MKGKFAFIVPPSLDKSNVITDYMAGLGLKVAGEESCLPPLSLLYAATILEKQGAKVVLLDCPAQNLTLDFLLEKIRHFKPKIVFLEIRYPSLLDDLKIAQILKKLKTKVFLVGPLAHFLKKEIKKRLPEIDGVAEEEMEVTIPSICRGNQTTKKTIPNLDLLPYPNRRLLEGGRYFFRTLPQNPFTTILTTRGCPYGCLYCPYHVIQGRTQRQRSISNVIGELKVLARQGYRSILFRDPTFTLDRKRTIALMEEMIKNKLYFQWWCETRTDRLDEELLTLMKKAGLVGFNFGVESGSAKIRQAMGRKKWEKKQTQKIIKTARKLKIKTKAFFMLGLPEETAKSLKATVNYAIFLNPDYASFMVATPFPGTKLFEIFIEQGHQIDDFFQKADLKFISSRLTLKDLEAAEKQAVKRFYLRPRQIFSTLKLLKSPAGFKETLSNLKWAVKK